MKTLEKPVTGTEEKTGQFKPIVILMPGADSEKFIAAFKAGFRVKLRDNGTDKLITLDDFIDSLNKELFPAKMNQVHCKVCNKLLSNGESLQRGIGPECYRKETGVA